MNDTRENRVIGIADLENYDGPDLYLFIGVSTAGSSIHNTFPVWAPLFNTGSVLKGVDLPEDAPVEDFRRLVTAMRDNPCIFGAVVTSHKLRLYRAISDLVDHMDPLVPITHEINSIDTRDGKIFAFARDAQSLDIVIDSAGVVEPVRNRPVLCIGSGGSAIALMLAMGLNITETLKNDRPIRLEGENERGALTILGRRQSSLAEVAEVQERAGLLGRPISLSLAENTEQISRKVRSFEPGGIVANATGLGKFQPGSPLSDSSDFPAECVAWDFNYRGPLTFLEQAQDAKVTTEDGWEYFLAGWGAALAAISGISFDTKFFNTFQEASAGLRP